VYLSCQSLYKYLPQYDFIFPAIAQQVPQAQFVFLADVTGEHTTAVFRQRLQQAFAQLGLDGDTYCVFLPRLTQSDYFNLNGVSDIYLDTLDWSGGNTTLEAIACHLPVVTCPGAFLRGRHSYAILQQLEVTDTIAQNPREYVQIAIRLGLDPLWREEIVQRLVQGSDRLYDDLTCVRALEAFYQGVIKTV